MDSSPKANFRPYKISWYKVKIYDLNNDGRLSREELGILEAVANNVKETNYLNHFRATDTNHDGYITAQELKVRFEQLAGKDIKLQAFTSKINANDQDGDGKLNYKEYKKAFFNA